VLNKNPVGEFLYSVSFCEEREITWLAAHVAATSILAVFRGAQHATNKKPFSPAPLSCWATHKLDKMKRLLNTEMHCRLLNNTSTK
jgi:hypothetical protein